MQELVTYSDFIEYDQPIYARVDRHLMLYGMLVIGVPAFLFLLLSGASLTYALLESLLLGGIVGTGFVLNERSWRRRNTHRRLSRVFANDPSLVPAPPPQATHRLVCGLLLDRQTTIAGSLYVEPTGLVFRSNFLEQGVWDRLLRRPRPIVPDIMLAPPGHLRLEQGWLNQTRFRKWLVGYDLPVLIIRLLDRAWAFRVPKTFETMTKLQAALDELRFGKGPATWIQQ